MELALINYQEYSQEICPTAPLYQYFHIIYISLHLMYEVSIFFKAYVKFF